MKELLEQIKLNPDESFFIGIFQDHIDKSQWHYHQEFELSFEDVTRAIRTSAKRGKAPALYRNPDNPRQTWSGKGEAPDWYTKAPNKEALRIQDS